MATTRERLDSWNKVCIENSWAQPREMDSWLMSQHVYFSPLGSAIAPDPQDVDNKYNVEMMVNGAGGEQLATLILEAIAGIMTFPTIELERIFWIKIQERLCEDFEVRIPEEVIPKYINEQGEKNDD